MGVNEENGLLLNKPKNTLTFRSTANLNGSVCFKVPVLLSNRVCSPLSNDRLGSGCLTIFIDDLYAEVKPDVA